MRYPPAVAFFFSISGPKMMKRMAQVNEAGKKVCMLSAVRPATEHRMLSKEGTSLVRAGYRVSIVAPHSHDEVISGISIKAVHKFPSRLARMVGTTWYVYRE